MGKGGGLPATIWAKIAGPPINTGTSIQAAVVVNDQRLKLLTTLLGKLVILYAIYMIFYDQVFWELQPAVPVTLGGKLEPALRKSYGGMYRPSKACSQVQNQHCGLAHNWDDPVTDSERANCTILAPKDLNLGELLFQDRLYVTTKQKFYHRESVCAGLIPDIDGNGILSADEPCIGTASSGDPRADSEKVIYSAGIEFLKMNIVHAVFNPWVREQKKHCRVPGNMKLAPISGDSACADYMMDPGVGTHPNKWTDGDLQNGLSGEGEVTGHGTCEDGDIVLLDQLLRAGEMDAIQEQAELTGGMVPCTLWQSVTQFFPGGGFWPWNCPTEESIRDATWNRDNPKFLLNKHGALKQEVRDSGAKIHVTIQYANFLSVWPIWPFSTPTDISYTYKVHLVALDEEKTQVTQKVSSTDWVPRFNNRAPTCPKFCRENPNVCNETNPIDGCVEFMMNQTMVEKHGLIVTFGQQGNLGSTANWLTLIIASLATISVLNGKVNATVRKVAMTQLKYTGSVFMTKPEDEPQLSTFEKLKELFPMLMFIFTPSKIWKRIKGLNFLQVDPKQKEVYIWNGWEFGYMERPEGFEDNDLDGDGVFSPEEQKIAREKKAAQKAAAKEEMDNPVQGMKLGDEEAAVDEM